MNLSQEKFATYLSVSFQTINRWEKGRAIPSQMATKLIELQLRQMGERGLICWRLILAMAAASSQAGQQFYVSIPDRVLGFLWLVGAIIGALKLQTFQSLIGF